MNTLLRSLIVWLLMLALPWQGVAAAAMVACAPAHQNPVQVRMQHAAGQPPCHEAAATPDTDDGGARTPHGTAAKCANCAACGIAAMLPASFPPLAALPPPAVSFAAAESAPPAVHLAQPERPPRPRLA